MQGSSLTYAAHRLGLEVPVEMTPPLTLEISSLRHVEGDIVDYTVGKESRAAGRQVKDLALPDGVVIALVARNDQIIPPQGKTRIEAGDHVIVVLRPATRQLVDQAFANRADTSVEELAGLEFPLRATTTVAELEDMYGIVMDTGRELTLDLALRKQLGSSLALGRSAQFGPISLRVRRIAADRSIEQVGLTILPELENAISATDDNQSSS